MGRQTSSGYGASAQPEWEQPAPDPRLVRLCREAGREAQTIRDGLEQLRQDPSIPRQAERAETLRLRGARWINQACRQAERFLGELRPQDLDRLNGCIGRVSAAAGRETADQRKLRAVIARRLGMGV